MQGFKRRRGSGWELRVYVGRDQLSGKKIYRSRTVKAASAREANRELAAFVTETLRTRIEPTRSATVGELLRHWFELAAPDFSPKTSLETARMIERILIPSLGALRLSRITTAAIDAFYADQRSPRRPGGPLAPATIRRLHGVLRRALQQGVRWGWLDRNPAAEASPPRLAARPIAPPTPAEIRKLLTIAEANDAAFATFLRVAAVTGARRGEVLGLQWSDVAYAEGTLLIGRSVVIGIDGLAVKGTKTGDRRAIAVDNETLSMLKRHHAEVARRAAEAGAEIAIDSFIFSRDIACRTPWRPDATTKRFDTIRRRAGLDRVRLHDLRHAVASLLLTNGTDVRTTAGRLGHRSVSTTLNRYAAFLPEADRSAAETMARVVSGNT